MRERISIRLPNVLRDELVRFAEAEGVSRSAVFRHAVRDYIFSRRFRALRRELIPYAEAQGIYTDEDVFRALS